MALMVVWLTINNKDIPEMIARGRVKGSCNRNIVEMFNPSGLAFPNFEIGKPSLKMRHHCPKMTTACCTQNELMRLVENWRKNQDMIKQLKGQIDDLLAYIDLIKPEEFIAAKPADEACEEIGKGKPEDFTEYIADLKKYRNKVPEAIDKFLDYFSQYFIGIACSICDAKSNRYFNSVQYEESGDRNYLYMDVSEASCFNAFRIFTEIQSLVNFMYKYQRMANNITCTDNFAIGNYELFTEDFKIGRQERLRHCNRIPGGAIFKNEECNNLCIYLHNPVMFNDMFNVLLLVDMTYLIMSNKFGELSQKVPLPNNFSDLNSLLYFYKLSKNPHYKKVENELYGRVDIKGINFLKQEGNGVTILTTLVCLFTLAKLL